MWPNRRNQLILENIICYVDAFHDRKKDLIRVVERVNGQRVLVNYQPEYNFYYGDPEGIHESYYGDRVTQVKCRNINEFTKNKNIYKYKKLFESDIRPLNKTLAKHYKDAESPILQKAFLDIEVDFCKERGYSSVEEAFMPITAIGVYLQWSKKLLCLAVPPKSLTLSEAQAAAKNYPEVKLCHDEAEMIDLFLNFIDDADVLSGWNSEGYDIPYIIHRIIKVLGKHSTRRLCLFNQLPKQRIFERFGKEHTTYDLVGRVHLDYLQLYKQYNYEERHSYKLDTIGKLEVGEKKIEYEGSLDHLYNNNFSLFLEYNIQDVMLLDKIDQKSEIQFIELANQIAHENTVLLPTVMGAVATTEQAIINECHLRGFVVPDRKGAYLENSQAAGAYVANPRKGIHTWIGSMDLNSLYPSVFRALNMSPETIVGQLRHTYTDKEISEKMNVPGKGFADAWLGKFACNEFEYVLEKNSTVPIYVDFESGESFESTGEKIYNMIYNIDRSWCLSANGTIFDCKRIGMIPGLLTRWHAERKILQNKMRSATTPEEIAKWDKRQLVKKINLNSLYGAILNAGCRFFDKRIGQSTTLTGRSITKHMGAETNKLLTGQYDHEGKTIIYGDTDSVSADSNVYIKCNNNEMSIAIKDLFMGGNVKWNDDDKEYSRNDTIKVLHSDRKNLDYVNYNYVYRHKVSKPKYKIKTANGKHVVVTGDHSIMILEGEDLIEKKPEELQKGDKVISVNENSKV